LLFYKKLVANLESDGFILDPYYPCVANKVVNEKQMTVCWHVDDLKVLHCDPAQVTVFGEWLSTKYGVAVATHRGKVHDYLGMIFNFLAKGKVMVTMMEHINTILNTSQRRSRGQKHPLLRTTYSRSGTRLWQRCYRKIRLWHSIAQPPSSCF
jgi:hypothetical protein